MLEQERKVGNEFRVDIAVTIDTDSFEMENLETSVSYADIYLIVEKEMKGEWLLLESVAKTIGDKIADMSDRIFEISVRITKTSVPIPGITGESSVEYTISK